MKMRVAMCMVGKYFRNFGAQICCQESYTERHVKALEEKATATTSASSGASERKTMCSSSNKGKNLPVDGMCM